MPEIVTIESVGHRGDGIARGPDGPLYVPFTLPGERVSIEQQGERALLLEVLAPSLDRTIPPCRHFGRCGGCALQMMPLAQGRALKRDFVIAALAQQKLETEVAQTLGVSQASRRRAVLTALRAGNRVVLGYNERFSNRLVDIEQCPILAPQLETRLAPLRVLLGPFVPARRSVRITALLTEGGLDLNMDSAQAPSSRAIPALAEAAQALGLARLSIDGEPVLTLADPVVKVGGVAVVPPPAAFLQASTEAESIMTGLAVEHLAGARRVADLFAGCGAFTFSLARHATVRAVENNAPALQALEVALRRALGLKRIQTERRDLFAFPLAPAELAGFDGVVFDPPRAGAKALAEALARSVVPRVVAVSCNPASFARDARILVDGGYTLERVIPVDQFVFSAETEVVGLFRR